MGKFLIVLENVSDKDSVRVTFASEDIALIRILIKNNMPTLLSFVREES